MRRNNQTNRLIKWLVAVGDFLLLNTILIGFSRWHPNMAEWDGEWMRHFLLFCNMGLFVAEWRYHTIIHERLPSSGQVLQRMVLLTMTWMITAYLLQKCCSSPAWQRGCSSSGIVCGVETHGGSPSWVPIRSLWRCMTSW